jgi:uncharacterized protein YbaR (Trm112 family)
MARAADEFRVRPSVTIGWKFGPNLYNPLVRTVKMTGMALSKDLLEILVCPVCKAQVLLKEDGSGLKCVECKRVYPVRDDIPIMLKDQATIEA